MNLTMLKQLRHISKQIEKLDTWIKFKLPYGLMSWESVIFVLIFVAVINVERDIVSLYVENFNNWIDNTYRYLSERKSLNILLSFSLLLITFRTTYLIFKTRRFSIVTLLFCIVCLIYLNNWPGYYLKIFGEFSYQWLSNICFGGIIISEIFLFIKSITGKVPTLDNTGLSIEDPDYINDGRKVYASTIANLVMKSPIREASFAVGISGEWGSGKTLVLNEVENLLKNKAIIIKFKPWNSKSPELLIDDFFNELRKGINIKSNNIGKIITKYATHIIDLNIHQGLGLFARISKIIGNEIATIDSLKSQVQGILTSLNRNVIILIDDLDRLDANELFETLRLIRNTADFKNVAYLATFDRDYVCKMLEAKGIANAEFYLEKIFTTTIALPSYEPFILVLLIYKEVRKRYGEDTDEFKALSPYIISSWSISSPYILNDYIKTYRDAIRFANHIIQDFEILKHNGVDFRIDINLREWFYVELLKFSFPKVCTQLRNLPNDYLVINNDRFQGYVRIKKSPNSQDNSLELSEFDKLLHLIFNQHSPTPNSIIHYNNYFNYFALRILSTELKQSEFHDLIENDALYIEEVLMEWMERKPSIRRSVESHFRNQKKDNFNSNQACRYIKALIKWSLLTINTRMVSIISDMSYFDFSQDIHKEVCDVFFNELKSNLQDIGNLKYTCKVVMAATPKPLDPSEPPDSIEGSFLSYERAEALSSDIFDSVVKNHKNELTVDSLSTEDSYLRILLENLTKEVDFDHHTEVDNYIVDKIIIYFDNLIKIGVNNKGTNLSEFVKWLTPDYCDDDSVNVQMALKSKRMTRKLFGSKANLEHIIQNWFDASDDDKQTAVNNICSFTRFIA